MLSDFATEYTVRRFAATVATTDYELSQARVGPEEFVRGLVRAHHGIVFGTEFTVHRDRGVVTTRYESGAYPEVVLLRVYGKGVQLHGDEADPSRYLIDKTDPEMRFAVVTRESADRYLGR